MILNMQRNILEIFFKNRAKKVILHFSSENKSKNRKNVVISSPNKNTK